MTSPTAIPADIPAAIPTASPSPPTPVDVDQLPPTQYLVLEVLAARHRTGERTWTFPTRVTPTLEALAALGLVSHKPGVLYRTRLAWLTDAGRALALHDAYTAPCQRPDDDHGSGGT